MLFCINVVIYVSHDAVITTMKAVFILNILNIVMQLYLYLPDQTVQKRLLLSELLNELHLCPFHICEMFP